ncbi:asparaginase domain-containing protein [Stutzerimonas azotifigens]|uniref:asparaginase domain-containing protein n=1 Tax=Stutzerimonas azotifigens TaxID=291995 RepID=UPI00040F73D0|nr:asparaginase domain-containing protein [Stutzerimonas azotifigens]
MSTSIERLLVLYTGGTIGMQAGPDGLVPASGFEARMRAQQAQEPGPLPAWTFRELSPPLDSANMTQAHWLQMAETVRQAVDTDGCDAVLLLHGTDTLAYSAAALAFLLLGLPAPLLLTGAMLPAGAPGSDAWDNLFGAMRRLQAGVPPGVHLYFNGRLLHGARVSKLRSDAFDAFDSLPRPRNAEHAGTLPAPLDYRQPRQPVPLAVLPLHPGVRAETVAALVDSGVRGLLIECYGSGTGPSDDQALLAALRRARAAGVVLAAISQCPYGHVEFGVYAAGSQLRAAGLVSGGGMTREAALAKLFALLGAGLAADQVEHWFTRDLCGEMADA